MSDSDLLRSQYEEHSYPGHLPYFAMPHRGEELQSIAFAEAKHILVAGCGNFEPLVVAAANPQAEITAVDLSQNSLTILERRLLYAKCTQILPHHWFSDGFGKVHALCGDIEQSDLFQPETYDVIICTGVLHHSRTPAKMLTTLSRWLKPTGQLRLMQYAPHSRMWVYRLQQYFAANGLTAETPQLKKRCQELLASLPIAHPYRLTWNFYSDRKTLAGIVDGFFPTYDKPLSFAALQAAAKAAMLELTKILYPESNRTLPDTFPLWKRLQIEDFWMGFDQNPVLLLEKRQHSLEENVLEIGITCEDAFSKMESSALHLNPLDPRSPFAALKPWISERECFSVVFHAAKALLLEHERHPIDLYPAIRLRITDCGTADYIDPLRILFELEKLGLLKKALSPLQELFSAK